MSNQLATISVAGELVHNAAMLDKIIPASSELKDDLRPHLIQLARANPEIEGIDFVNFVQKAYLTGADPRRNQVYLVPYKKKVSWKDHNGWQEKWITQANTIFAYQFFIAKANSMGDYRGYEVKTEKAQYFDPFNSRDVLTLCSTATVKREGRDPLVYRAYLPEFVKTKKGKDNGPETPTEAWLYKPYLMLEKCAVANAFRLAWPEAMSGMYIAEEMQGEDSRPVPEDTASEGTNAERRAHGIARPQPAPASSNINQPQASQAPHSAPIEGVNEGNVGTQDGAVIDATWQEVPDDTEPSEPQADQASAGPAAVPAYPNADIPKQGPVQPSEPEATKQQKGQLFLAMQREARKGALDLNQAILKVGQVHLTGTKASELLRQLEAADYSFFNN